jgi:rhodanese-related sulfurtransferase
VREIPEVLMNLELIGADDLRRYMDRRRYVLVDLRSASAYCRWHIPGSVNIPYEEFDMAPLRDGRTYVLLCERGVHSLEVAKRFYEQGIRAVAVVAPYEECARKFR